MNIIKIWKFRPGSKKGPIFRTTSCPEKMCIFGQIEFKFFEEASDRRIAFSGKNSSLKSKRILQDLTYSIKHDRSVYQCAPLNCSSSTGVVRGNIGLGKWNFPLQYWQLFCVVSTLNGKELLQKNASNNNNIIIQGIAHSESLRRSWDRNELASLVKELRPMALSGGFFIKAVNFEKIIMKNKYRQTCNDAYCNLMVWKLVVLS